MLFKCYLKCIFFKEMSTPSVYAPLTNSPVNIFTNDSSILLETPPLEPLEIKEHGINN